MTREELQDKSLVELIELAKNNGIKSAARKRKAELIELLQSNTEIDLNNSKEIHANEDAAMMGTPLMETNQEEAFDASAPEQEQVNQAPSFRPISEPQQREERPRSEYRRSYPPTAPQTRSYAPRDNGYRQGNYQQGNYQQGNSYQQGGYRQAPYQNSYQNNNSNYQGGYQRRYQNFNEDRQDRGDRVDRRSYVRDNNNDFYDKELGTSNPVVAEMIASGECKEASGILEIMDGYGFLRAENYYSGTHDVYIAIAQIRRFSLRTGDLVEGRTRPRREGDKYEALMYIDRVNGMSPDENAKRCSFEDLVPIFPNERYTLEVPGEDNNLAVRLVDLIAPIGKGQRAMIVSQPKAGKTTLLKQIAHGISANFPDSHLIVLLIDERPEEVTEMKRCIQGEVVYSTFDELPEHHTRIAEMVQERAMRLVETGKDVVILMDSLTRLTRAYNLVIPPTGRTLSGGMDPGALHKPKRFFGAARNIEGGGSLTVIATALVETGSRMDDIVYEEFKGTGNMEIHLDRKLAEKRVFPAIDIYKSGTRREELLLSKEELDGVYTIRRVLSGGAATEVTEQFISMLAKTTNNDEFLVKLKDWVKIYEKDGYTASSNRYDR